MKNGIKFNVCGLNFKYFVPFFAVVMLCTYLGILPTAKVYSNDAGTYVATTFVATVAFLMCIGGLFFWLGNTIPIVNNYLGGACLLPLFGASLMNYLGLIPENLQNGCKVLMKTGFQDAYIALLLVGSVLVMDRKVLLNATARYLPTVIGSQVLCPAVLRGRRFDYRFRRQGSTLQCRRSLYVRRFCRRYDYPSQPLLHPDR